MYCKEIKPVNPEGNQSWIVTGRTDAKAEAPILWPSDVKSWLIWKDPDAGKEWRQEEKRTTEDEMVGWHHRLNGHEFEQAPGVGDGQGSLACYSPWGRKELDMTEGLNWTELPSVSLPGTSCMGLGGLVAKIYKEIYKSVGKRPKMSNRKASTQYEQTREVETQMVNKLLKRVRLISYY